jgi:hypothetical protein
VFCGDSCSTLNGLDPNHQLVQQFSTLCLHSVHLQFSHSTCGCYFSHGNFLAQDYRTSKIQRFSLSVSVFLSLCFSVSLYIEPISSLLTPPVAATFLMAIFWHRTTEPVRFNITLTFVCKHSPTSNFLSLSFVFCLVTFQYVFLCLPTFLSLCLLYFFTFFCLFCLSALPSAVCLHSVHSFRMAIFWHRTTEPVRFSITLSLVGKHSPT